MDGIRYWIETEGTGHWFFVAFPIILLCLFIWFKGRRVRFLIPSLLISVVIINPWFYKKWEELGLYAYWRILWVLPVVPVIAGMMPSITERIEKVWLKGVVAALGVSLIVFGGTFLYSGAGGSFVEAANAAKLPDYVVQIADRLLELNEHPRVIAQDPIGVYIRQYTGRIDTLFGRNIHGYIYNANRDARNIYAELNNPESNLDKVVTFMLNEGYDFLVLNDEGRQKYLSEMGFTIVDRVAGFGIYEAHGKPSIIKIRNELGQVISITTVGENGNPVNNTRGYSTISYTYDQRGFINGEFYMDANGNRVADSYGCAGFVRENDRNGLVIMERSVDSEGNPVMGERGYSELRREYINNALVSESYYDDDGEPINCINGYERIEWEYDENSNIAVQRFLNTEKRLVITGSGYAEVHRVYDGTQLIREEYYGPGGEVLIQPAGHIAIDQTWEEGELKSRTYLGIDGKPMNRVDGYSSVIWESGTTCKYTRFFDLAGNELDNKSLNLVDNIHSGESGWSDWLTPDYDVSNGGHTIGVANLGIKNEGDTYTCSIEIEFKGVTGTDGESFRFWAQGAQDDKWNADNVWNDKLVYLEEPPKDGIYKFVSTVSLNERMVDISRFGIGFRCDFWSSGSYRVKNVIIQKGETIDGWHPGL